MEKSKAKLFQVKLNYYNGLFDQGELEVHKIKLRSVGVDLIEQDKSGIPMMFLDEFTNQISLTLSNPVIQAYVLGQLINGGYDVLKGTIIWAWNSLIGKKITKIHVNGEQEAKDATFGLNIEIDEHTKVDLRLTGDVSDELKSKCIDNGFELIKTLPKNNVPKIAKFAKYDWDKQKWLIVNINEEIGKLIEKQKSDLNSGGK